MSSPAASEGAATDAPEAPAEAPEPVAAGDAAEAKQEDGEEDCGFCTYMRAGPCGEVFTAWEACVEDHRNRNEDFAKGCVPATRALTECMSEHKDYYELPDQEAPAADAAPETAPIAAATVADAPAATASVESAGGDAAESRAAA